MGNAVSGVDLLPGLFVANSDKMIYASGKHAEEDAVTVDDFEPLKVIGQGSFGKVMLVQHKKTKELYAMKVLRKDVLIKRKQVTHTKTEKNVLEKIKHPFIVDLAYAFQTDEKLFMVLEFINGGEMFFHLSNAGRFNEDRVRLYAAEIVLALEHLHKYGIIYRDLKPENVLVDCDGHVKITDFGLSKEIMKDGQKALTFCGTPEYLAPEILKKEGHDQAVDWWSLGNLVYEMLTGHAPFAAGGGHVQKIYSKILSDWEPDYPKYVSPVAKKFMQDLMHRDHTKRLGSNGGGAEVKAHEFFKDIDFDKVLAKGYTPQFKPPVKNAHDTSNFDSMFTNQPVGGTGSGKMSPEQVKEAHFDNFSYVQARRSKSNKSKGSHK